MIVNLFPLENYLATLAITSVLCSWSARPAFNIFLPTKSKLYSSFELSTQGLNKNYGFAEMRLEEIIVSDAIWQFVLAALIKTPITIFKAFCEGGDPNISIASKIFMAAKMIEPKTPLITMPGLSFLMMFYIWPTPFTIIYDGITLVEGIAELADLLKGKEKDKALINAALAKLGQPGIQIACEEV